MHEKIKKIAIQGEKGSYSEEAAFKYFKNKKIEILYCTSFEEAFKKVKNKKANSALIPIENSWTGSINEVYDLLLKYNMFIIGEYILKIKHCLLALKKYSLSKINKVFSHPQAIEQCRNFLKKYDWEIIPFYDTAGSAKMIKKEEIEYAASIASKRAAKSYNLKIIKENIQDTENNYTRFIEISNKKINPISKKSKTSLIFATRHIPGALYKALEPFAKRKINLTKLESRPDKEKAWQYIFYLDFEGNINDKKVLEAIKEMKERTKFIKFLGSYKKAKYLY